MRDPARIHEILKVIEELWQKEPDWRLGQLFCNLVPKFELSTYFIEDDEVLEQLKTFLAADQRSIREGEKK